MANKPKYNETRSEVTSQPEKTASEDMPFEVSKEKFTENIQQDFPHTKINNDGEPFVSQRRLSEDC